MPAWLKFDQIGMSFYTDLITPITATEATLKLTATDPFSQSVSTQFKFTTIISKPVILVANVTCINWI